MLQDAAPRVERAEFGEIAVIFVVCVEFVRYGDLAPISV